MGQTHTLHAIVLRSFDVGEADRFCILLTKERGKIAVRARGVRKPSSKMGGSLLPLTTLTLLVREGSAGYSVNDASGATHWSGDIDDYLKLQQGIEILLSCLQDEEPLPEIYALTEKLLETSNVLAFTISLLHQMGLLPHVDEDYFRSATAHQKDYIRSAIHHDWIDLPTLTTQERQYFSSICAQLISEVTSKDLKVGSIMKTCR